MSATWNFLYFTWVFPPSEKFSLSIGSLMYDAAGFTE